MGVNEYIRALAIVLAASLTACAPLGADAPTSRPMGAATQAERDAIADLRTTYAAGRYGDVIREVSRSNTLAQAPLGIHVESMKLQAFSYCLTNHRVLCEDQFRRILKVDPAFELAGAERGHPQWQPAFDAARQR